MPPSTFQKKIDIEESIGTVCPLLSALLMVWKSQRSKGQIFNNNLLDQENCPYFFGCPRMRHVLDCVQLLR